MGDDGDAVTTVTVGPMTSSAGGDDRAGHAAGARRRAKQRNDSLTHTDRRPASGGRQGQPGRPKPPGSAGPHVQGPGREAPPVSSSSRFPSARAGAATSPSRGGRVPGRERLSTVGQRIKPRADDSAENRLKGARKDSVRTYPRRGPWREEDSVTNYSRSKRQDQCELLPEEHRLKGARRIL
ncbi:hypothetical protein MRX96_031924 [Rhipicephalus microplus]